MEKNEIEILKMLKERLQKRVEDYIKPKYEDYIKPKYDKAQIYFKDTFGIESVADAKKAIKKAKGKFKTNVKSKFKIVQKNQDVEPVIEKQA